MIDSTAPSREARRPLYQRLMRRRSGTLNTDAEALGLGELLRAAPGAEQVKVIGWHRKGGYEVGLVLVWSEFDAFIAYLEAHDWMLVI